MKDRKTWYISFGVQYAGIEHSVLGRTVDHVSFETPNDWPYTTANHISWLITGGLFCSIYEEKNKYMHTISQVEGFEYIDDLSQFIPEARARLRNATDHMKGTITQLTLLKDDDPNTFYEVHGDSTLHEAERCLRWISNHSASLFPDRPDSKDLADRLRGEGT